VKRPTNVTTEASNIVISPITPDDYDGAAEAIASGPVFQWYGMTHESSRAVVESAAAGTVVARAEGQVVGVAIFRFDGLTPVPAYLRILAVNEGWRGQGVGRALLHYVEEQAFARGPNLFLCCVDRNVDARRFYEREGSTLVGPLPDLIAPGITEVLFRKTLGPIRGYESRV
jgi:GNAT superfamily N-acetyltransferase